MPFKFSYKSVFLLLTTLSLANILFSKPLMELGFTQEASLLLCTSLSSAVVLTMIASFSKTSRMKQKTKLLQYFVLFLLGSIAVSYLFIYV